MYDRILLPTDGSDAADVATEHGLKLARTFDAPLHVLYVVETSNIQATDAFATSDYEATYEALASAGAEQVDQVTGRAEQANVDATGSVVEGAPATTIVEEADDGDVIVMGTHGRTGLDRYLIGSTTEKVVRTADVPVITIPMTEDSESAEQ